MSREGLSPVWIAAVILVVLVASGFAVYWWMGRTPADPPLPETGAESGAEAPEPTAGPVEVTEPRERPPLPPLDSSDDLLRGWVAELSNHPRLVRWLASEDLVRRFVAAVDNVARGDSPRAQLEMMEPEEPFQAAEEAGRLYIAPDSFARYDLASDVFSSLDIGASVRLFHDLEPLFEEAYAEIGEPTRTFRQAMA
ncbi:MAG: DUF3014 domain-containing protein, partial [Holophagales bacterium]|nr:DUF3014 domain-containing protein [Holophagales bacterium]